MYGQDRRLRKEINLNIDSVRGHGHNGLKRTVAHIHHWRGGRDNNVHYLSKKDIKQFGKTIESLGGKLRE